MFATPSPARAQDLEPRAYANAPVGMNFVLLGYAHSEGGVATDPSVPLTNADIQIHRAPSSAYARALDLWGLSGKFAAALAVRLAVGNGRVHGAARGARGVRIRRPQAPALGQLVWGPGALTGGDGRLQAGPHRRRQPPGVGSCRPVRFRQSW